MAPSVEEDTDCAVDKPLEATNASSIEDIPDFDTIDEALTYFAETTCVPLDEILNMDTSNAQLLHQYVNMSYTFVDMMKKTGESNLSTSTLGIVLKAIGEAILKRFSEYC